ncbi:MAG: DUF6502 family protein [Gammaproteobacteria bacterium]
MGSDTKKKALSSAIAMILAPLIRILLRNGMSIGAFYEIAKQTYVRVAENDFEIPGKEQTTTRIATITGLTRKEVLRIRNLNEDGHFLSLEHHNRASRVISAWVREPEFQNKRGGPSALPFEGQTGSFSSLAKRFSGDIPARTILEELLHSGAVTNLNDGRIKLVTNAYVPRADIVEKITILGTDVTDLISTIDHNLVCEPDETFFQRKVWYNNIPEELISELRQKIVNRSQATVEALDQEMANCDRDVNPEVDGTGRKRAVVSIYYFEEQFKE